MVEIVRAQNLLSDEECQEALDILNKIDGVKGSRWYQTQASAQACFSSFREISFFASGIQNIVADTSSPESLGGSLSQF